MADFENKNMKNSVIQNSAIKDSNRQKIDEEIINNLDLVLNLETLEESDLWVDLTGLINLVDDEALDDLESEK